MKKLILIVSVILFVSCSSDDDAGDVITNQFEQIKTILPQGTWKVSKYVDGGTDKTINFESFTFTFKSDGIVIGQTDLFSEEGAWAYESTAANGERLVLKFNPVDPFVDISDNWDIISLSGDKVELSNVGSNNEHTELLSFSKL